MAHETSTSLLDLPGLFHQWDVDDIIIQKFMDNGITVDLLKTLTDEDLKELCSVKESRIILKNRIREHFYNSFTIISTRNEKNLDESSSSGNLPDARFSSSASHLPGACDGRGENSLNLPCTLCDSLFLSYNAYVSHLKFIHQVNDYFHCPMENCPRVYHTQYSLKYHLENHHSKKRSNILERTIDESDDESHSVECHSEKPAAANQYVANTSFDNIKTNTSPQINSNYDDTSENINNIFFSELERLISHLYSILDVPRSLIQIIFKLINSMFTNFSSIIKDILLDPDNTCETKNIKINSILGRVKESFNKLSTDYLRIKHFTSSKCYVQPEPVIVGTITKKKKVDEKIIVNVKKKLSYIIPLEKSLKIFLEIPGVFNTIYNYQKELLLETTQGTGSILRNIIQGSLWTEIVKKFDNDQILIPLIISFDDLETGNPLGSRAGKNKLGAVYTSIATIPPNMSSRLENIFLSLIFYSHDRSDFGNEKIFSKFIYDLKKLELDGIQIKVDNNEFNVKFVTLTIAGDNLGLNSITGFAESFNATYFCRICTTTKSESMTQVTENLQTLREVKNYDSDVENLEKLKSLCIWNDLPSFHVYENWSCDVMHDLMEGIHRYSMALIIKNLVNNEYFTVDRLNKRLKYFLFSDADTVIPPISETHVAKGYIIISASEMLCLVRNFNFIVGDLVEYNDKIWKYYLVLLELTEILTAQTFTSESIEYLETLITEHNQMFQDLFDETLKPKYHILLHYPRIIRKFGPVILFSCFKYESKHREIKKVCNSISCRKQLPLSAANRCQLKACCRYLSKKGFNDSINYSKYVHQTLIGENQFSVDWYEINGVRYKIGSVIISSFDEFDEPIFHLIDKIIVDRENDKNVTFECLLLDKIIFDPHLRAFNVVKSSIKSSVLIKNCNSVPLTLHNVAEKYYVSISKM
ncbi:uncharacterized protein LOC130677732 [Microplitis mediator]|uniref:uncharacterized protein LOC130677732 n=1 Tax=Microplitis mediator TaxID=375433 RepID=UPI0025574736|nr:uncharacterized protein LOC130677732 [Microplitis mediator]